MQSKIYFMISLSVIISLSTHGNNDSIQENSKTFELHACYTGDAVYNAVGGIRQKAAYLGIANLDLNFNTENAGWWNGGNLHLKISNTHGETPSADIIGDLQIASNIEAGSHTFLQEAWYRQSFGILELTLGLQDLNQQFVVSEYGSNFLNSSFGVIPTISSNLKAPIFPLTSFGVTLKWEITNKLTWLNAMYDGEPTDFEQNPYNVSWKLNKYDGLIGITELQFNDNHQLPGIYKIGIFNHSHFITNLILNEEPDSIKHNFLGAFAYVDKMIWKNNNRSLGIFTQTGYSFTPASFCKIYFGAGINYLGIAKRDGSDILGLAVAHAGLTNKQSETATELTYHYPINDYIYIQPDVQYIINPLGVGYKLRNSLTGIIRFGILL